MIGCDDAPKSELNSVLMVDLLRPCPFPTMDYAIRSFYLLYELLGNSSNFAPAQKLSDYQSRYRLSLFLNRA